MKLSFHDPHQFVPSRSSPEVKHFAPIDSKASRREKKRNQVPPPQFISYTYTHTYIYTHISYVLIALSRGSDPLHVRRFRADRPRSKSWWYRGWNVTWILGIKRASTRAPQIINSSAASLSNAGLPVLPPSLTELFNFRNRWICEQGTIAPRYERLEPPAISTLAEATLRVGEC